MSELNTAQEQVLPNDGDLGMIFKILNEHQDMLSNLKVSSRKMEKDIDTATRLLTQ